MNRILQKCIEELRKEEPRIDYVLGLLEALAESDTEVRPAVRTYTDPAPGQTIVKKGESFTPSAPITFAQKEDPAGRPETPEERKLRLAGRKVPPAFLGDTTRMFMDPSKTDGRTDVTRVG